MRFALERAFWAACFGPVRLHQEEGGRREEGARKMSPITAIGIPGPIHGQMWESVVLSLRLAIVTGSLAPGTHLVESDLAHRLNVSRGPIREIVRVLPAR